MVSLSLGTPPLPFGNGGTAYVHGFGQLFLGDALVRAQLLDVFSNQNIHSVPPNCIEPTSASVYIVAQNGRMYRYCRERRGEPTVEFFEQEYRGSVLMFGAGKQRRVGVRLFSVWLRYSPIIRNCGYCLL